MCGIVGYVGSRPCLDILYQGLSLLEYRGYDSAGITLMTEGVIQSQKNEGKLSKLKPLLEGMSKQATMGLGHTRWATHGAPSRVNAHPHGDDELSLVHNGIIENYKVLKNQVVSRGARYFSETDTEVMFHMLRQEVSNTSSFQDALFQVIDQLEGAYSLGVITKDDPEALYLVKQGSPLVVGLGDGENYFASDALGVINHTKEVVFLEDGQVARLTRNSLEIWNHKKEPVEVISQTLDFSEVSTGKGANDHYMQKEIYEQPRVISKFIDNHWKGSRAADSVISKSPLILDCISYREIERIHIIGCGTAYLAGKAGQYMFEELCGVPTTTELASEFRYRKLALSKNSLVIAMSQSGETADTLACVKEAKSQGVPVYSICNVEHSSLHRESSQTLLMRAGPEVGVASTKAFTMMLLSLYSVALKMAQVTGSISKEDCDTGIEDMLSLPHKVEQALGESEKIKSLATSFTHVQSSLYIGRGYSYPIAVEGALKLKEISYIHAEGYAGGELKHGPIALVDEKTPIIAICSRVDSHDKMLSNIEEVCARGGLVLGVGASDDWKLQSLCKHYINCPQIDNGPLQAILSIIPLQLLSYYVALSRGANVDQPRNLAKSVTVE